MTRIDLPDGDGDDLQRLWSMNPGLTRPAAAMSAAVYGSELVPVRTRELMRRRIAEINVCDI